MTTRSDPNPMNDLRAFADCTQRVRDDVHRVSTAAHDIRRDLCTIREALSPLIHWFGQTLLGGRRLVLLDINSDSPTERQ